MHGGSTALFGVLGFLTYNFPKLPLHFMFSAQPLPLWSITTLVFFFSSILPMSNRDAHFYGLAYGVILGLLRFRFKLF